jgi:hypothetical protein
MVFLAPSCTDEWTGLDRTQLTPPQMDLAFVCSCDQAFRLLYQVLRTRGCKHLPTGPGHGLVTRHEHRAGGCVTCQGRIVRKHHLNGVGWRRALSVQGW